MLDNVLIDARTRATRLGARPPQAAALYAELGLDAQFHLSEALGFSGEPHQPTDVIELNSAPDKPLVLDWAAVPLVSSSFA